MQPYFLPYLGYFQLIDSVDRFLLYDNFDYSAGGWINRNRILELGKGPLMVSVPVGTAEGRQKIRDTRLSNWVHHRRRLFRSLDFNYSKAPHYSEVRPFLDASIPMDAETLGELNISSIGAICSYLEIDTDIIADSTRFDPMEAELRQTPPEDYRRIFPWLVQSDLGRRLVRVLALCRALDADTYVNSIGGRTLYDAEDFARHGIELLFVQGGTHRYDQPMAGFCPDLSIVDVLMNCGRSEAQALLANHTLVR